MILRAILAVAYATGRVSHARQVKGDDPDEKGYPVPPGWGLDVRLTTPPHKKYCYEISRGGQAPPRAVEPMMMMMMMITCKEANVDQAVLSESKIMQRQNEIDSTHAF
jgi:hypothetical protein